MKRQESREDEAAKASDSEAVRRYDWPDLPTLSAVRICRRGLCFKKPDERSPKVLYTNLPRQSKNTKRNRLAKVVRVDWVTNPGASGMTSNDGYWCQMGRLNRQLHVPFRELGR